MLGTTFATSKKNQINQDIFKSKLNNTNAYSIKTDAFVIDTCNIEKARHLIEFHIDIRG